MTATEYRNICNALMRSHHHKLLIEAISRGDEQAIAREKAILSQIRANI